MDTASLLKKLISFRTTADRVEEIKKAASFLRNHLEKNGIWTRTEKLDGKPVLYACTQKTTRPSVLLVPHLDVVEGEDSQFFARQKGNMVYGRGARDCKNNVAVVTESLISHARSSQAIGAFFSSDEEIGGATTKMMVQKGYLGKTNLLLDGERAVVQAQKGILNLEVTVKGKSAHGAHPWKGENANEKIMTAFANIKRLFPLTSSRNRWHPTVNLGIMSGGDVINKVPDKACMHLNIRLTETARKSDIVKKIRAIPEVASVSVLEYHAAYQVNPRSPAVRQYRSAMEKALKEKLPLVKMHGATDAHNFAGVKDHIIISGAGGGSGEHGKNERVNIKKIRKFRQALDTYLEQAAV